MEAPVSSGAASEGAFPTALHSCHSVAFLRRRQLLRVLAAETAGRPLCAVAGASFCSVSRSLDLAIAGVYACRSLCQAGAWPAVLAQLAVHSCAFALRFTFRRLLPDLQALVEVSGGFPESKK